MSSQYLRHSFMRHTFGTHLPVRPDEASLDLSFCANLVQRSHGENLQPQATQCSAAQGQIADESWQASSRGSMCTGKGTQAYSPGAGLLSGNSLLLCAGGNGLGHLHPLLVDADRLLGHIVLQPTSACLQFSDSLPI